MSRKMEQAVIALLLASNLEQAARAVGVSSKTLQRWQRKPEFEKALRDARMLNFRQSMARLQQASAPAVTTLMKLMVDPGSTCAIKARCAYYILDQTRKGDRGRRGRAAFVGIGSSHEEPAESVMVTKNIYLRLDDLECRVVPLVEEDVIVIQFVDSDRRVVQEWRHVPKAPPTPPGRGHLGRNGRSRA